MNIGFWNGSVLFAAILAAFPMPLNTAQAADAADAARGNQVFDQNCAGCHGGAGGGGFGPKLAPISARKDRRPVIAIVKAPGPDMPPLFPASLSEQDVTDVAAYLQTLK